MECAIIKVAQVEGISAKAMDAIRDALKVDQVLIFPLDSAIFTGMAAKREAATIHRECHRVLELEAPE